MDNIGYNKHCFSKQKDKYEEEYKRYMETCLSEKQKNGAVTVVLTTEEFNMIDALRQAVQAAVVLLDNAKIRDAKEIKFLSGSRYIIIYLNILQKLLRFLTFLRRVFI